MKHLTTSVSVLVVCILIAGAYIIGAATETHFTLIVDREQVFSSAIQEAQEEQAREKNKTVPPPKGIEITAPNHPKERVNKITGNVEYLVNGKWITD
jgi:hypothetical protein